MLHVCHDQSPKASAEMVMPSLQALRNRSLHKEALSLEDTIREVSQACKLPAEVVGLCCPQASYSCLIGIAAKVPHLVRVPGHC